VALITCAGADVLRLRVHMSQRRAWWGWLDLDVADAPSGKVQIAAAGGMTLTGTIKQPSGVFLDAARVRIVGGAGGLDVVIAPAAYENAQLGDPLRAVLSAAGETLSTSVLSTITSVFLSKWTLTATPAARALDELCYAASAQLGQIVVWRVLSDGTVWLGAETWPAQKMPAGADVLESAPAEGRFVIGASTPFLVPGVNLDGVGNVAGVDHWVTHSQVRSDAWI
jgi:hypothetical protein